MIFSFSYVIKEVVNVLAMELPIDLWISLGGFLSSQRARVALYNRLH